MPPSRDTPTLISLAVHELRTPANVVWGYLRMLQGAQTEPLSARQRRLVDEAERSCTRLLGLVDELNEVDRLDHGRIALVRGAIDLFALAAEAAADARGAPDRGVRLDFRGPDRGAALLGDAQRLKRAVAAVFHSVLRELAGPRVVSAACSVRTAGGGREGIVTIGDAERAIALVDETPPPFDDLRGGMGLSLPLARRVIAAHGGRLASAGADAAILVPLPT